ncbi:MAG TPA: hypothetical protein VM287_05935 [Egibacteraceae bacterium]|nr:hypothetical protein [Egibacteraceae bacterium]
MQTEQSHVRRRVRRSVAIAVAVLVAFPAGVWAADGFSDVPDGNTHHDAINAIRDAGVTLGCATGRYCPDDSVRRDQMASFMDRLGALSGQEPVVNARTVQGLGPDELRGPEGPVGPAGPPGPEGPRGPRGESATGLFAVVNADGTLLRGAETTTVQKMDTGRYAIVFDRSVSECTYNATISLLEAGFINAASTDEVAPLLEPGGVVIVTRNAAGTYVDRPFHLTVFC